MAKNPLKTVPPVVRVAEGVCRMLAALRRLDGETAPAAREAEELVRQWAVNHPSGDGHKSVRFRQRRRTA